MPLSREVSNRRRREAQAARKAGLVSHATVPLRSLPASRPRLKVIPAVGMVVLLDCWPPCRGTVLQVDTHMETLLLQSDLHGLLTVWWREVLREVGVAHG